MADLPPVADNRFPRIPLEKGPDGTMRLGAAPPEIEVIITCETTTEGLIWALGAPNLFHARAMLARVLIYCPRAAKNPNGMGAMMMDTKGGGGLVFWRIKPLTPAAAPDTV